MKTYDQDNYVGLDQDVLKTPSRRLLKTYQSCKYFCLQESSEDEDERRHEDVFKTSSSRQKVNETKVNERVNETKVILRKALIDNFFAIESDKESRCDKRPFFRFPVDS